KAFAGIHWTSMKHQTEETENPHKSRYHFKLTAMAKRKSSTEKGDPKGIPPLHFFGERDKPDGLEETLTRRSIQGDRKIPSELEKLMSTISVYQHAGKNAREARIQTEKIDASEERTTWKVDIPVNREFANLGIALPGRTALKEKPDLLRQQTDPHISFNSYRPSWIDGTYSPRIMTEPQFRKMKRFNNRRMDPLY